MPSTITVNTHIDAIHNLVLDVGLEDGGDVLRRHAPPDVRHEEAGLAARPVPHHHHLPTNRRQLLTGRRVCVWHTRTGCLWVTLEAHAGLKYKFMGWVENLGLQLGWHLC